MASEPTLVLDAIAFGEGPRWRDGRLYFSDMHAHRVIATTLAGEREVVGVFGGPVSGLGWLPDGRMLVVSMEDRRVLRREPDGRYAVHADLSDIATGLANDMVVAADGTAYVGNFGFSLHPPSEPRPAKLARITPQGEASVAADDLMFPNGMIITPDGATLVVGESFSGKLTAFDIGPGGALGGRYTWAELPSGAVPDGICLDADGAIWVASPSTREVLRVREGGDVLDRIRTEQRAIACMLGGADMKTLFILTAEETDPDYCRANHTARLLAARVTTPRSGRP